MKHANRYDGLTWCSARDDWSKDTDSVDVVGATGPTKDLDAVTCVACLRRIAAYGENAATRLREIT